MWFKKDIKKIKERYEKELFKKRGVVAIGLGHKITKGIDTGEDCICVYVKRKMPEEMLLKSEIIPKKVGGIKTDCVEIGELTPLQLDHRKKYRPCPAGVSVGHYPLVTAGTIGAYVKKNNKTYILTNAHIGAPHWNGAKIGDPVVQPGKVDGGQLEKDKIGELAEYIEIKDENNLVDACLVEVAPGTIKNEQLGLGTIIPETAPRVKVGDIVKKSSRTSGVNEGRVIATDVTAMVNYRKSDGSKWLTKWKDQVFLEASFVRGGDSGSIVLKDMKPCGLIYAGSDEVGVMNQVDNVQRLLGFQWLEEKKEKEIGYVALGYWLNIQHLEFRTLGFVNFRSSPEIKTNNIIRLLPKDTKGKILECAGLKDNYIWVKCEII